PSMFGQIPSYGFFVRHVSGIEMNNVEVSYMADDARPAMLLSDVKGADFTNLKAQHAATAPIFVLKNVENFSTFR
ncbi:MAG: glycoside hydrolase family 28 protein, partial [Bacteroidota bacterium]|nr:glycoside hydrolase family 28 protein [Bacteroidota bacterium]